MKTRHWITVLVLIVLMALALAGLLRTREQRQPAETDEPGKAPSKRLLARSAPVAPPPLVDERPLQTARRMGATAANPEEQALARSAEKVGDHEVDLAFFDALRTAEDNPPQLSSEAKQILDRKDKAELALKEQARLHT